MPRSAIWLLAPSLLAVAAIGAAAAIGTEHWATWLEHPAREPGADATWDGARLLRIMLVVGGIALIGIPLGLWRLTPSDPGGERHDIPSRELWTVTGLVVVALVLRATRLTESLWYDEIAAWLAFGAHGPGAIIGNFFEPSNHVAHTLATWLSVAGLEHLAGFEIALRAPALIASLASVLAVYALARNALGAGGATMAALLIAVWPVSVLEGAEARGYSMMILASATATWMLLSQRDRERSWLWCLYAVVCALGIWTHFVTAFIPIGHGVWLAWRALRHRERAFALRGGLALALVAVLTVVLYAPAIPDLLDHRIDYTVSSGDEPTVLGTEGWHAVLEMGGSWYTWATWPGMILIALGAWRARHDERLRQTAGAAVAGLPLFFAIVLVADSWMYARFALFALPGSALLAAAGIMELAERRRAGATIAVAIVVAASIADLALRPPKQPLRDAAEWIRARHTQGEAVLVIGLAHQVLEVYLADLEPGYSLMHGADLPHRLPRTQPTWIVVTYPYHVSAERYALLSDRGFKPVVLLRGWADWGHGDIQIFKLRADR